MNRNLLMSFFGVLTLGTLALSRAAGPSTSPAFPTVVDQAHLHNAHVVTDKVISGAQPEGEASFKALQELGVKTILSVDGAAPDVETARKYGLRYVHMPITYSGVTDDEGRAIAKSLVELPGPIYVHCHHGKHRSAAAVAVACVYNGTLQPQQTQSVLQTFGTGKNYLGLWKAALEAKPLSPEELAGIKNEYVETAKLATFTEAMVGADQHWDHVKQMKEIGWRVPPDHPDLDPAHEVLQANEHLREAARLPTTAARPEDFRKILDDAEQTTGKLSELLRAEPTDAKAADALYQRATESCAACHKVYRD